METVSLVKTNGECEDCQTPGTGILFFTSWALTCCPYHSGNPSTSVKLPASSAFLNSSGEGQRDAKYLHMGPTQQPSKGKDWAHNSNKCTIRVKTSHWQQAQHCSPCSKRDVSRAAAIPVSIGWSVTPDYHLLWFLVTLQEGRQERKKKWFFLLTSQIHFSFFPSLLFTSQVKLLWHARWAAFIPTSLEGCWFSFLEYVSTAQQNLIEFCWSLWTKTSVFSLHLIKYPSMPPVMTSVS